ncbi:MAG: glycosyltransferase [Bacteroidales bacterium]|nr:glycosyltransferase [Bacteroidales bacterium]
MRILQLCHKLPYPPSDGGSIAMNQITQGLLNNGYSVKVVALAPPGSEERIKSIPESYIKATKFEALSIDTRIKVVDAFLNLFTKKSYNIARFYSKNVSKRLAQILQNEDFDIIQLEGLFLTPYIPVIRQHTGAPLLFRSHNIEHFIWERLSLACKNPLKKIYLRLLAKRLKRFELKTVHQVDGLIAISPVDMQFFLKNGFSQAAVTIPVAVDPESFDKKTTEKQNPTVFHIGSMDWRPNQEGLLWFLDHVWPLVSAKKPDLRFVLAGKNIPGRFYEYDSGQVHVAGEVPDASAFMLSNGLMVVPLQSGGGMRVKIIEGMAAGKAIVSTSIGAEGISCLHGENILLADTPDEMADAIIYCFDNPAFMNKLANNAKQFARTNHHIQPVIDKLTGFYKTFYKA